MELYRISGLPPAGKLFVGIFTALVLCVCLWSVHVFYIEEFADDYEFEEVAFDYDEPAYDAEEVAEQLLTEDPDAVHAPVWDSNQAGLEETLDVEELAEELSEHAREVETYDGDYDDYVDLEAGENQYHENVGLAHTHISGQALLFFAIGLVFLFTSASTGFKKTVYWLLGLSIVAGTVGFTGAGYHTIFDILAIVGGAGLLIMVVIMAVIIFRDLGRKSAT